MKRKELHIYSCCYINDGIDFKKLFKLLNISDNFNNEMDIKKILSILLKNKVLVEIKMKDRLELIIDKINLLLKSSSIDIELDIENNFIAKHLQEKNSMLIYNLNVICKYIRNLGYELVQLFPIVKKKTSKLYFVIIPIDKLLDLAEIGYMG